MNYHEILFILYNLHSFQFENLMRSKISFDWAILEYKSDMFYDLGNENSDTNEMLLQFSEKK